MDNKLRGFDRLELPFLGAEKPVLVLPESNPAWELAPTRMKAHSDEVHIFRINKAEFLQANQHLWNEILRKEELDRYRGMSFYPQRNKFVLSRAGLRIVLGKYLDVDPRSFRLKRTRWGKPGLYGDFNLEFNISHTKKWLLVSISFGQKLGIDGEEIQRAFDYRPIVASYFHPLEQEKLESTFSLSQKIFFQLWTRKEALSKLIGLGLHDRLLRTNMLDDALPQKPLRTSAFFAIHSFLLDSEHIGALAIRNYVNCPKFFHI